MSNMKPFANLRTCMLTLMLLLQCALWSTMVCAKNVELNAEGYQNYMKKYDMYEDFKKEFVQETENGTLTLTLEKPMSSSQTDEVWGTILLESKLPFQDDEDLRITMEFGKRDHFNKIRRRRYTMFGDPADGNFTIFTIATEKGSKENLTDYRWWTSLPQNNKTFRYDFFEYPGSMS